MPSMFHHPGNQAPQHIGQHHVQSSPPFYPRQAVQQGPTIAQLNDQLMEIQRFYQVQRVPCPQPEFDAYLGHIRSIQEPQERFVQQQNLIFHLQQLLNKNTKQQLFH